MKFQTTNPSPATKHQDKGSVGGLTLVELLIAVGIGSLLLSGVAALTLYGARSFSAIGNFADMDADSRQAMDFLGREFRQASAVTDLQTNLPLKSITLATSTGQSPTMKLAWDSQARTLTFSANAKDRVLLNECDYWDVKLYNAMAKPTITGISLNAAPNPWDCKLIKMSWICSRTNQGQRLNTESLQRMEVALRNKFNY